MRYDRPFAIGDFFSDIAGYWFLFTDLVQGIKSLFGVDQKAKVDIFRWITPGRDVGEQAKDDPFEQERLERQPPNAVLNWQNPSRRRKI